MPPLSERSLPGYQSQIAHSLIEYRTYSLVFARPGSFVRLTSAIVGRRIARSPIAQASVTESTGYAPARNASGGLPCQSHAVLIRLHCHLLRDDAVRDADCRCFSRTSNRPMT